MKLLWTTIYVKDLTESVNFYTTLLGLKLIKQFSAGPGIEIAFLGNGKENETLIELMQDTSKTQLHFGECISIGFATDSIQQILCTVEELGITKLTGLIETPGSIFFTIKDPNGLTIQFFQQK